MIYADDSLINEYNQPSRDICAQVDIVGIGVAEGILIPTKHLLLDNEDLISLSVKSSLSSGTNLSLGNISTKKLTFKTFFNAEILEKEDEISYITVSIGIKPKGASQYTMTTIGKFYLNSMQSTDNFYSLEITAYDKMTALNNVDSNSPWLQLLTFSTENAKEFVSDALSYAGLNLNEEARTVNRTAFRTSDSCDYNSDGTEITTENSYGISKENLVFIPAYIEDITLIIHTSVNYSSPLKVCFFSDFNGDSLSTASNAYRQYTGYSVEAEGEGYKITQSISRPGIINNLFPLYMGISILGSNSDGANDTYEIQLTFPDHTTITNGNRNLNWDELKNHTYKELISYSLATLGMNYVGAYIKGNGTTNYLTETRVMPYQETGFEIPPDIQYLGEFRTTQFNPLSISYITSGSSEAPVTVTEGDGKFGFSFVNTIFTDDTESKTNMQIILARYSDLKNIMPGTIKYRGNPFVEVGDIVIVRDRDGNKYNFIINENEIRFSGGLSCTISSNFELEKSSAMVSSATSSITQVINTNNSAILNKVAGSLTTLWSGTSRMGSSDSITLPENISDQPRGIILEWQLASSGTADPYGDSSFQFIPKGKTGTCVHDSHTVDYGVNCAKRISVDSDNKISGSQYNTQTGTSGGITYANDRLVLINIYSW